MIEDKPVYFHTIWMKYRIIPSSTYGPMKLFFTLDSIALTYFRILEEFLGIDFIRSKEIDDEDIDYVSVNIKPGVSIFDTLHREQLNLSEIPPAGERCLAILSMNSGEIGVRKFASFSAHQLQVD